MKNSWSQYTYPRFFTKVWKPRKEGKRKIRWKGKGGITLAQSTQTESQPALHWSYLANTACGLTICKNVLFTIELACLLKYSARWWLLDHPARVYPTHLSGTSLGHKKPTPLHSQGSPWEWHWEEQTVCHATCSDTAISLSLSPVWGHWSKPRSRCQCYLTPSLWKMRKVMKSNTMGLKRIYCRADWKKWNLCDSEENTLLYVVSYRVHRTR